MNWSGADELKKMLTPLSKLKHDPKNARKHNSKNLETIKHSLKTFGQQKPIVVLKDGTVIAGNGTMEAAAQIGWDSLAVVKFTDAKQARAFALADNRSAELASWDGDVLGDLLKEIENPELLGFELRDMKGLGVLPAKEAPKDEAPELPKKAKTRPGDIYALGKHRLLCGDSLEQTNLDRLMVGKQAGMVFTDPPWNVNYGENLAGGKYKNRKILNDSMNREGWAKFLSGIASTLSVAVVPGGALYCVMGPSEWPYIDAALRDAGFHWSSTIIWVKDTLVLSPKDYHTQYEPIWYGWNGKAPRLVPVKDRKQSDTWQIARPKVSDIHPTMKPVELVARAIENSSEQSHIILDLFLGSGTTLMASEQMGRACYGFELDPRYCDAIVNRWEEYTGKKAVLLKE